MAQFLAGKGAAGVGLLTTDRLAVGMIVFTLVMTFDLAAFGYKMREDWGKTLTRKQKDDIWAWWGGLFALPGRIVLGVLCLLICTGWSLAARGAAGPAGEPGGKVMGPDIQGLIRLNEEIGAAENAGDAKRLADVVAPRLVFRRRDGTMADRDEYLKNIRPGNRDTRVESVQVYGDRAVVTCVVTDAGQATHNVRLFVKVDGRWRLLGWANEPS
ncbi:MAG: nuclear transport factor 2 family protein [Gemmataceae bacterium]|nr:nuclear transport factor 2 family protein [Gemmataceae bacterium]